MSISPIQILIALLIWGSCPLSSQPLPCPSDQINTVRIGNDNLQPKPLSGPRNTLYTIPVVVHIVWKDPLDNLSDQRIQQQIQILNQDYQQLNADLDIVPFAFANLIANVGFDFCLATKDPNGNPTSGIERRQTEVDDIGSSFLFDNSIYQTNLGGLDAWDTDHYLNIWVAETGAGGPLGFGSAPGSALPGQDGVIIDSEVFGPSDQPDYGLGRTATHEIGHYFNLLHIWGSSDDCSDDDWVDDTPLQGGPYFGCANFPSNSCGNSNAIHNFMGVENDDCLAFFTEGQKTRMLNCLENLRPGLLNAAGCMTPAETVQTPLSFQVFPNPVSDLLFLRLDSPGLINGNVCIRDVQGKTLLRQTLQQPETRIDVSNLPRGVYILSIQNQDREIARKLICR